MLRAAFETFTEVHTVSFPVGIFVQFSNMIFQGVPERFPKLRLAFLEIGCTWLPYWLDRMDEHWEKRGKIETPHLTQRPSDCVRQRPIFFSLESEETLLPETFRYLGDDHFLYATDIPHWDSEFPDNLRLAQSRKDLSDETKNKLLYDNAKSAYTRSSGLSFISDCSMCQGFFQDEALDFSGAGHRPVGDEDHSARHFEAGEMLAAVSR